MPPKKSPAVSPAVPVVPISPDDLLTLEQVAERLQQPAKSVYSLTRSRAVRRIPYMKCGKALRFSWASVSEWLRASQVQS
jgi:hypothetical protein